MASGSWSDDEIAVTIDVYFQMLTLELAGESYTKTTFRREVEREVARSSAAIEYKFNNVSAVLDEMGAVWIPGYKPLRNVQAKLRSVVRERFEADSELRAFMLRAVAASDVSKSELGKEVDPPTAYWPEGHGRQVGVPDINFAAVESANRALGLAGERTVLEAERERLSLSGRADLAAEVRHVSVVDGDGEGYDIRSFHGRTYEQVFIEVKTTQYGKEVPFYLSANELEASNALGTTYRLWRLYRYGKPDTGYYRLPGPLARHAQLRPDTYRGLPSAGSH